MKQVLADPAVPKAIHDSKAAMHVLGRCGIALAGVQDDCLLYAYLLDLTYTRYGLSDVAFRYFNLKTGGLGGPPDSAACEQARNDVVSAGLRSITTTSICRCRRCWHEWKPRASRSTPKYSPKCRSGWSVMPPEGA